MKRICKKCGVEKDIFQFEFLPKHKKINRYRRWTCNICISITPFFETLDGEIWKDIEKTDGKYQVSNLRRFRSFCIPGSKKLTAIPSLIKKRISKTGYWVVDIYINYKKFTRKSHHLFAQAFMPNPNNLPQVNHKNGIKIDDSEENLEWSTHADNMRHAFRTGLIPIGEDRNLRKLSKEQARSIFNSDKTHEEIANEFKISKGSVYEIKSGITWRSLNKTREELYQ